MTDPKTPQEPFSLGRWSRRKLAATRYQDAAIEANLVPEITQPASLVPSPPDAAGAIPQLEGMIPSAEPLPDSELTGRTRRDKEPDGSASDAAPHPAGKSATR